MQHVHIHGWKGSVPFSPASKRCLSACLASFDSLNGQRIPSIHNAIPLSAILEPSEHTSNRNVVGNLENLASAAVFASDTSDHGSCVYSVKHHSDEVVYHQARFTSEENRLSSRHRELLAVLHTLKQVDSTHPLAGRHILWITDSTNLHISYKRFQETACASRSS